MTHEAEKAYRAAGIDPEQVKTMRHLPLEEVPWANGKPYLISSDTYLPENFLKYFQTYHRRAGRDQVFK